MGRFPPASSVVLCLAVSACMANPLPTQTGEAPTLPLVGTPLSTPSGSVLPATATASPPPAPRVTPTGTTPPQAQYELVEYEVTPGSHPHDVAPAPDGTVWYTAQATGSLGLLDPRSGAVVEIPLGDGSAPHGVIVGPDGLPWVTDQGANTIVRVDYRGGPVSPDTTDVTTFAMPDGRQVGPHTPTFDDQGVLWFTGQASGLIGRLDPATGEVDVFEAPRGPGPYGIDATPAGDVWYVSLAQSYLARIDRVTGESTVFEPPTPGQGARRVWSDSVGRLWVSEWNAGQLAMYDPTLDLWREWALPGPGAQAYAVFVDDRDQVWVTDFGTNSILRFDPTVETFETFALPSANAAVRQLLGRDGEVWGAESGADKLVVIRRR